MSDVVTDGAAVAAHADWLARPTGRQRLADAGLWLLSALLVFSLQAGLLFWFSRMAPQHVTADDGPPPALMVELAPMTEAVSTGETVLSPDSEDSQISEAAEAAEAPEPEPVPAALDTEPLDPPAAEDIPPEEPLPETPPAEQPPEPLPDEIPQKAEVALPVERSVRPQPRPERESSTPEKPRKPARPKPQAPVIASAATEKARTETAASDRDRAPQSAAGSGRSMSPARWQSRVLAQIERNKPRSRGTRGLIVVSFRVDTAGNLTGIRLAGSSGSVSLDEAALTAVRRASPVPPPPPGAPTALSVTVKFDGR